MKRKLKPHLVGKAAGGRQAHIDLQPARVTAEADIGLALHILGALLAETATTIMHSVRPELDPVFACQRAEVARQSALSHSQLFAEWLTSTTDISRGSTSKSTMQLSNHLTGAASHALGIRVDVPGSLQCASNWGTRHLTFGRQKYRQMWGQQRRSRGEAACAAYMLLREGECTHSRRPRRCWGPT